LCPPLTVLIPPWCPLLFPVPSVLTFLIPPWCPLLFPVPGVLTLLIPQRCPLLFPVHRVLAVLIPQWYRVHSPVPGALTASILQRRRALPSPVHDMLTNPFLPAPQVIPNRRAKPLLLLTACWTPCWACWVSLGSVVWRFLAAGSFRLRFASGGDYPSGYGTSVNSAAAHRWAFGVVLRQSTPLPYGYCNASQTTLSEIKRVRPCALRCS
jgi:hypothetical protein